MMSALAAAAGSFAAKQVASHIRAPEWERTNYAGDKTSLVGGLDVLAGLVAGSFASGEDRGAALVATLAGAGAGYIDDHLEDRFPATGKGFRGHLGALKDGRVSSGVVKIATIGGGSVLASGMLARGHGRGIAEAAVDAAVISLSANVINLLDLRPGRARKAAAIAAALPAAAGSRLARVHVAAASLGMADDLRGTTMLGDLGANALGAHLGVVLTACPIKVKASILGVLIALNAASEKVSFSRIIEDTPGLRELDMLGRVR